VHYVCQLTQDLLRMKDKRMPKLVYEYILTDRRKADRPKKRWTAQDLQRLNKLGWIIHCCS
jgi:hypothetical protein